jgi:hypothetical protein
MTAWQLAAQFHEDFCPHQRLIEAVAACIPGGLVYSTDTLLVLAYEARWDEATGTLHHDGAPNAWVCKLAACTTGHNPIAAAMDVAPHRQHWAVWQRRNDGRWRAHRWDRLETKFCNQ